jgi:hypothetical protein
MFLAQYDKSGVQIKNHKSGRVLVSVGKFTPNYRSGGADEFELLKGRGPGAAIIECFTQGRLKWNPSQYDWDGEFRTEAGRARLRDDLKTWHTEYVRGGREVANTASPIQIVDLPSHWGA